MGFLAIGMSSLEKCLFRLFFFKFIYLFLACVGSSFLCQGFLQLRQVGTTLHHGAWASHYRGLPCCRARAPDAQAQQLWLTGLVAPRHVGSSQTRAQTRIPCIGRQTLNHCATREALDFFYRTFFLFLIWSCRSCLYILEINPLSVASFANVFSHSEGCHFILFMVSFAVQKLLTFIRSHFFCFVFILITLVGGSKQILL